MLKKNKGFTLIEFIIAISIFSIVIAMGYKVINGISITNKNQNQRTNEQTSINLVNKYLTKDIENIDIDKMKSGIQFTKNIVDNKNFEYVYKIDTIPFKQNNKDINCVEYKVKINGNYETSSTTFNGSYDIVRTTKFNDMIVDNIELVSKLVVIYDGENNIENIKPFKIEKSGDLYSITMDYLDKEVQKYKFSVVPRASVTKGNNVNGGDGGDGGTEMPKPEIPNKIPDEIDKEFSVIQGAIGFWAADARLQTELENNSNLAVWITDRKDNFIDTTNSKLGKHEDCGLEKKHNIQAFVNTKSSGNSTDYANISELNWISDKTFNANKSDKIIVYLSKGTKVTDLNIKNTQEYTFNEHTSSEGKIIYNGSFNNNYNIKVEGNLQITGTDGYVLVVIGKGK